MKMSKLPEVERPREKLLARGVSSLSDQELLAIVLGPGSAKTPVLKLAEQILSCLDENPGKVDFQALRNIPGVGPVKAMIVQAMMEFVRRRIRPEGLKVKTTTDALPLFMPYADRKQEHFICITLNGANEVINTRVVTIGLVNESQVHAREVFADAIVDRATAVVLGHNHPSGNVRPSKADVAITRRLVEAGKLLGIRVIDHLIFSTKGHYSFRLESDLITGDSRLRKLLQDS